jgi:type I restriction enzyme S subunit
METVGEDGTLGPGETRQLEQVWEGYTYFRDGDVAIAKITPCFENGKGTLFERLVNGIGFGTTELHVLRARDDADARFVFYLTRSLAFRARGAAMMYGAAGQKRVPEDFVKDFVWGFAAVPEQRSIAAFLDRETAKIDALVARQERLIELLQEKRTALISHAVTKGLDPAVPMKDTGIPWIGEIPAHWEIKTLKRISPSQSVGVVVTPSRYVASDGEVPFLFGSDVSEGSISTEHVRRITSESNALLSKSVLRSGDLVTVRVGYPGVTAIVLPELDGCNCASMMIVRQSETFLSEWLCNAMNSRVGKSQIDIVEYGAAQKQFNISHAVEFVYPVPPLGEQHEIASFLEHAVGRVNELQTRTRDLIQRLHEYRTALISAAVTGKIDVRDNTFAPCEATSLDKTHGRRH